MPLPFNPQRLEDKELGREHLTELTGLRPEEVQPFFVPAAEGSFMERYNRFVRRFPRATTMINSCKADGIGPGELVAYYVFDNIYLGGKNSDIDLKVPEGPFAEVKAGELSRNGTLADFKITKDSDLAVSLLLQDLNDFNEAYREITGCDLPNWAPGQVPKLTLESWASIDLEKLAEGAACSTRKIPILFDKIGTMFSTDGKRVSHLDAPDIIFQIKNALSISGFDIDKRIATINKITDRWRNQAFSDYIDGKLFALIDRKSLEMIYFGHLTKNEVGLHRVTRNQPKASYSRRNWN